VAIICTFSNVAKSANPTEGSNEGLPIHVAPPQTSTTERVDEKDQLATLGEDESSATSNRPPEAGSSGTSASFGTTETSSLEDSTLFSDEEVGDNSSLVEYDLDGEEPELRISDPEMYFENLNQLCEEIEGHSCWWIHSGQTNVSPEDMFEHLCDLEATESMNSIKKSDIWDSTGDRWMMAATIWRMTKINGLEIPAEIEEELFLLECLEVLRRSYANVLRLQRAGFCGEYITVAAQDWMRPQVVRLSRVFVDSIHQLCCEFRRKSWGLTEVIDTKASFEERYKSVNEGCRSIISEMGLPLQPPRGPLQQMAEWQATVQAIDLAIVSYAGTHIRPFTWEVKFQADKDQGYLKLPIQFASYHPATKLPEVSQIFLRRRRLLCLDAFLGGREIWVFQRGDDMSNQGLYLSTGLEELTDLWGPSWRLFRNAEPDHIQSIEIGNGCIIPWSTSRATDDVTVVPDTTGSEVYCHWVFSLDWNSDEVERCQQDLDRKYFLESDTFLIGVPDGLRVNPDCNPSREEMIWKKTRLEESEALHPPNTSYSRRYKDSHSIAFTANIPIAGSHAQSWTYKRQEGMLWKSALVERWRNKRGVPGELENFSGLEISLCTQNARRVRLLSLLGSDTMRHYLHSLSFSWPSGFCWETYFEAFQSVNQFRIFWNKHNKIPKEMEKIKEAIAESLEILQGTGVNNFSWELGALWVAVFENEELPDDSSSDTYSDSESGESSSREVHSRNADAEPKEGPMPYKKVEDMIVSLFRSEYTWTPFLMDSPKIITMAIITTSCLEATDDSKWGRRCQRGWREGGKFIKIPGYPVLATSLFVNESILESKQLVSKKLRGLSCRKWDTRGLCATAKFSLGDHGELEVLTTPTRNCPVTTMEWQGVIGLKESWNEIKDANINEEFFGRGRTPHHKEHISGEWETLPLPILIISKASKPLLLK
jgi:hypothetical protein